jgi:hypothetical protein
MQQNDKVKHLLDQVAENIKIIKKIVTVEN